MSSASCGVSRCGLVAQEAELQVLHVADPPLEVVHLEGILQLFQIYAIFKTFAPFSSIFGRENANSQKLYGWKQTFLEI